MNASAAYQNPSQEKKQYACFFWVSHASRCVSFHPEEGFAKEGFASNRELWSQRHRLIALGYLVQ